MNVDPKMWVHSVEWKKVLAGDPGTWTAQETLPLPSHPTPRAVEIYPNDGYGMKVMTVDEWTSNWKRNGDLPDCLVCGSLRTREHHFLQDWCRGAKNWSSESLCLDCHGWSYRSYKDDAYLAPEDRDKLMWDKLLTQHDAHRVKRQSAWPQ